MDHLEQHIESLVFTSESPITVEEVRNCLKDRFDTKFKKGPIQEALLSLQEKYQQEHYSFELIEIAGGFQFLTKTSYHGTVGTYLKQKTKKRLSKAALETLSIIAYKQPVIKSEMEKIRGVSCDYAVQKLLEKELVSIVGRGEGPGKPLQYGTSAKFMDYFGLKNIEDLPQPKDFREPDNEIGEKAPIDEDAMDRDHSTSDPAALRAKVAANLSRVAAAKPSPYEALMLDVSIGVAIAEIIVDGGDLSNAILLAPVEEEVPVAEEEVLVEEEIIDTVEAPKNVVKDEDAKELENKEAIADPELDQNNIEKDTTNNFIPSTPLTPSNGIAEADAHKEVPEDIIGEHIVQEVVTEVAVALAVVEAFLSKENSDNSTPDDSSTATIDLKKKA